MRSTEFSNVAAESKDGGSRLRVAVYDALAAAKGYRTVAAQAEWHGLDRSTMFRVRSGQSAHLDTAMRMARDLGTTVEVLFEWVPAESASV